MVIYLQVSITGQMVIFSTRTHGFWFLEEAPSVVLLLAFVVAQVAATFIAVYADMNFTHAISIDWGWATVVWVWSLIWYLFLDPVKVLAMKALSRTKYRYVISSDEELLESRRSRVD